MTSPLELVVQQADKKTESLLNTFQRIILSVSLHIHHRYSCRSGRFLGAFNFQRGKNLHTSDTSKLFSCPRTGLSGRWINRSASWYISLASAINSPCQNTVFKHLLRQSNFLSCEARPMNNTQVTSSIGERWA